MVADDRLETPQNNGEIKRGALHSNSEEPSLQLTSYIHMTTTTTSNTEVSSVQRIFNRVPEITIFFWAIKILGTTVGETAADFLNVNLNLGLTITSILTGALLVVALFFQFKAKRYIPSIYWSAVVLISVFGTLVTDNLTDSLGVPLEASTIFFSLALAITFALWYAKEKTLSMHSIVTGRREAFYWLAILFTFALGTAAGDLMAEGLGLGYATTGLIVAGVIALLALAWKLGLNSILAFWAIYILTRPLGASLGDFLSQSQKYGGLGLGATMTSVLFLAAIIASVYYLSRTKTDVTEAALIEREAKAKQERGGLWQTAVVVGLLLLVSVAGYTQQQSLLQAPRSEEVLPAITSQTIETSTSTTATKNGTAVITKNTPSTAASGDAEPAVPVAPTPKPAVSPLGDLSSFRTITEDTLALVNQGDLAGAKDRIADLEYEWDTAEGRLKPMNKAKWIEVDDAIDAALRQLRSVRPSANNAKISLETLLTKLN